VHDPLTSKRLLVFSGVFVMGLYDVLGNACESGEDRNDDDLADTLAIPRMGNTGSFRVNRGGSWLVHSNRLKAYFRDFYPADQHRSAIGFRVVCVRSPASPDDETEVTGGDCRQNAP
jgi:formylglycine-generating enzyme required for sulfatase activity